MKAILLIVVAIIVGARVLFGCMADRREWQKTQQKIQAADSFERCKALGFPVGLSYPEQCQAGDKTFRETVKPWVMGQ